MVRPCKECENEHKRCGGCDDWNEWFPQAFDFAAERIRRETTFYDTHEPTQRPITYRDIVFWTVFTEQWR